MDSVIIIKQDRCVGRRRPSNSLFLNRGAVVNAPPARTLVIIINRQLCMRMSTASHSAASCNSRRHFSPADLFRLVSGSINHPRVLNFITDEIRFCRNPKSALRRESSSFVHGPLGYSNRRVALPQEQTFLSVLLCSVTCCWRYKLRAKGKSPHRQSDAQSLSV